MKRIKKFLIALAVLTLCLSTAVPVSAAVKISAKSVTLVKGQSKTLKVTGTKSKITWSSSKKAVATVTSKGKVTAKGKGTATITAKVGKKKYTCKVNVETPKLSKTELNLEQGKTTTLKVSGTSQKVIWKSNDKKIATVTSKGTVAGVKAGSCTITATVGGKRFSCKVTVKNAAKSSGKVQYESYKTPKGVAVIVKNKYSYAVSVHMDCVFYSASNKKLNKVSDFEYALESGRQCALFANNPSDNWTKYKISLKAEKASPNVILNAKNIKVTSNYGDGNVMVSVKNNGKRVEFTKIAILFYVNGKVVGHDFHYAEVNNKGMEDTLEFRFPYDKNFNTIVPDAYKLYINCSYRYDWQ